MMQVIPKWKVTVQLAGRDTVFWISDAFLSNVLRMLAAITFGEELGRVTVEREPDPKTITASEFDRKFDAGEDITGYLDLKTATRSNRAI